MLGAAACRSGPGPPGAAEPRTAILAPEDCPGPEIAPGGLLAALSGRPEGDARRRSRNRAHPCYG
jgi:hypothetical protein